MATYLNGILQAALVLQSGTAMLISVDGGKSAVGYVLNQIAGLAKA